MIRKEKIEKRPKLNPEWDPNIKYIPRKERKEWVCIGMIGKVLVRDDGTCEVGGYCYPNKDGIATKSDKGYLVIKRISDNQIKIILK